MQAKHWMLIAGLTLMAPLMTACDNKAPKEGKPASSEGATPPAQEPAAATPAEKEPAAPAGEGHSGEGEGKSE